MNPFLISFLDWLPKIFLWPVLIAAFYFFYFNSRNVAKKLKFLIFAVIGFRIVFAGIKTFFQYFIWINDEFGKLLLPPHQPIFYFLKYVFSHFWINAFLAILISFLFWRFLKALNSYNSRFFGEGDIELGFLAALVSGWPGLVLFLIFSFIFTLLFSVFRGIFLKEAFTRFNLIFVLSAAVVLLYGGVFLEFLGLGVLKI